MDRQRLGEIIAAAVRGIEELELASVIDPVNAERLAWALDEAARCRYRLDTLKRETLRRYIEDGCAICGTLRGDWGYLPAVGDLSLSAHAEACWGHRLGYLDDATDGRAREQWERKVISRSDELLRICERCMEYVLRSVAQFISNEGGPRSRRVTAQFLAEVDLRLPRYRPPTRREARDVYFAEADGVPEFVKIGMAVSAEDRLTQLGLRPILIEPGGAERERLLHQRFAELRVPPETLPAEIPADGRTEWFTRRGPLAHYLSIASAA